MPCSWSRPSGEAFSISRDDLDISNSNGAVATNVETTRIGANATVGYRIRRSPFEPGLVFDAFDEQEDTTVFPSGGVTKFETRGVLFGPNMRFWFTTSGVVRPWAEISAGVIRIETDTSDADGEFLRGAFGVSTFPNDYVSIDAGLRVTGTSLTRDSDNVDFDDTDLTLFFGLSTFF